MRHFCGKDDRELHKAGHFAVLAPCRLIDELADSFFLDSIDIRPACGEKVAYYAPGALSVAWYQVFADKIAMLAAKFARGLVHIYYCSLTVAHRDCTVHIHCPIGHSCFH